MTKQRTKQSNKQKVDSFYENLTNLIIKRVEETNSIWDAFFVKQNYQPTNFTTKKSYSGINKTMLSLYNHKYPYYMGFKQAMNNKTPVKKGAKSIPILVRMSYKVKDAKGTEEAGNNEKNENCQTKFFYRVRRVFNIQDCSNVDFDALDKELATEPSTTNNLDKVDKELKDAFVNIQKRVNLFINRQVVQPLYNDKTDTIKMPLMSQYKDSLFFFKVLFHELAHWTGHPKRINRKELIEYSRFRPKEELIAELTAVFLFNTLSFDTDVSFDNSAAYIKSWLECARQDKGFIISASRKAKKATEYLLEKVIL